VGLVFTLGIGFAACSSALGANHDEISDAVTEYAGTGVAEFVLTPDLPDGYGIAGAQPHGSGMVLTVPVDGWFRAGVAADGLAVSGGDLSSTGPAMTFFMRDLEVELDSLQIGFTADGRGAILYGSEFGPRYGRPVLALGDLAASFASSSEVVLEAPVFLNEYFANGVGIAESAGALVGTLRMTLFDLTARALVVVNPDDKASPGEGAVAGGPGPSGEIGPDVFTLEIGPDLNKYGTVDGVTGYAMDTTSCNQGDEWAVWLPSVNQHPLIAQNLFRISNNRFEQIGMSWLKHAWCAADFFACAGGGSPNGTCSYMTIGIADIYNANLNADQTDLGPRSEVNAATGEYPYPYVLHWNQTGDDVFKRLQVRVDDLIVGTGQDNSDIRYLAEVYYVTTDESTFDTDTQYNNASWRRVVRVNNPTDGGYNLNYFFPSETHIEQTALEAWPQFDLQPDAWPPTIKIVNIGGEEFTRGADNGQAAPPGRVIVGYNVTDLGDGMWAYDYTIYNYNSHRAIRSLTIPAPDDDPNRAYDHYSLGYHSDEPHLNTPWNIVDTPGTGVTWSTDPWTGTASQGGNEMTANAIRWSTAHSFHLESTYPPDRANASLGIFRPGSPSEVFVDIEGPAPDCNDNEVADGIDIQEGGFEDVDSNGVPDVCQDCILLSELVPNGSTALEASLIGTGTEEVALRITGDGNNADVACVDLFVQSDGTLGAAPFSQTIDDWGAVINISGDQIMPNAEYTLIVEPTNPVSECELSTTAASTWIWSDVNNNSIVNLEDAFLTVLDFQSNSVTPSADVQPCGGNGLINLADVSVVVGTWQGNFDYVSFCGVPCQ
jgi:hypothetical protein